MGLPHLAVRVLQKGGYEVLVAEDGEEALEQVAAEQPDAILLDIVLPE